MSPPIAFIVALVVGMTIGHYLSQYRSRRDLFITEQQIQAHVELARRQYEAQLESMERQRLGDRLEEAYRQLNRWLISLERTIDTVWEGSRTQDVEARRRTQHIIDEWPWETLQVPTDIAPVELYWSKAVREEIREFKGASSAFIIGANYILVSDSEDSSSSVVGEVRTSRSELLHIIDRIRQEIRTDLGIKERLG